MLTAYNMRDRHIPNRKRQYAVHQGHYDYFFSKKEIRDLFSKEFNILKISEGSIATPDGIKHSFYHAQMKRKLKPTK